MTRNLLLLSTLILTGCATLQERFDNASYVSEQAVYYYQPDGDNANLTLFRARGLTADICNLAVYINQHRTVVLQSEQKVTLAVPTGQITIQTSFEGNKYCANLGVDDKTIVIEPQTMNNVTLSVFGNGGVKFESNYVINNNH